MMEGLGIYRHNGRAMNGLPTTNRELHPYKTQESQSEKLLKSAKSVSSVIQMNTDAVR